MAILFRLIILLCCVASGGCSAYSNYSKNNARSFALGYSADSRTGTLSYTITPIHTQSSQSDVSIAKMDDRVVAAIIAQMQRQYEEAKQ
jgi:hypothetical protein